MLHYICLMYNHLCQFCMGVRNTDTCIHTHTLSHSLSLSLSLFGFLVLNYKQVFFRCLPRRSVYVDHWPRNDNVVQLFIWFNMFVCVSDWYIGRPLFVWNSSSPDTICRSQPQPSHPSIIPPGGNELSALVSDPQCWRYRDPAFGFTFRYTHRWL